MTVEDIAAAIRELNLEQLAYLKELISDDWDGLAGVGVREPRRPLPESDDRSVGQNPADPE